MAKKRKRTITYRTEFASKPPSQRKEQLNLMQIFLRLFFTRHTPTEDDQTPRPGPTRHP